jgi:hypothetical protein
MTKVAVAYIYDMWLSLAIKIMALHATPLEFLPHAQDITPCAQKGTKKNYEIFLLLLS